MYTNKELKDLLMKNYQKELETNNFDAIFKKLDRNTRPYAARFLLQDVGIPILDYMSSIPEYMFIGRVNGDSVGFRGTIVIPGNIKKIGESAFIYTSYETVKMLKGIQSIGKGCFFGSAVKTVIFPEGLTKIEKQVCSNCPNLEKVYIPKSVTRIGEQAFGDDDNSNVLIVTEWRDSDAEKLKLPQSEKDWYRKRLKFRGKSKPVTTAPTTEETPEENKEEE